MWPSIIESPGKFFLLIGVAILITMGMEFYHYLHYEYIDALVVQQQWRGYEVRIHYAYKVGNKTYAGVSGWYGEEKRSGHRPLFRGPRVIRKGASTIMDEYPAGSHFLLSVNKTNPEDTEFDR